jgi:hypothetical protein
LISPTDGENGDKNMLATPFFRYLLVVTIATITGLKLYANYANAEARKSKRPDRQQLRLDLQKKLKKQYSGKSQQSMIPALKNREQIRSAARKRNTGRYQSKFKRIGDLTPFKQAKTVNQTGKTTDKLESPIAKRSIPGHLKYHEKREQLRKQKMLTARADRQKIREKLRAEKAKSIRQKNKDKMSNKKKLKKFSF